MSDLGQEICYLNIYHANLLGKYLLAQLLNTLSEARYPKIDQLCVK